MQIKYKSIEGLLLDEIFSRDFVRFLVRAKKATYAGSGKEVSSQRPGFKELVYLEDDFEYRDSYAGYYMAPGQEVVRYRGNPLWAMAYSGGMLNVYQGDKELVKKTFDFLKKALSNVSESLPYRGPEEFKDGHFAYINYPVSGIIAERVSIFDFHGREEIRHHGTTVFRQRYLGGIIIPK